MTPQPGDFTRAEDCPDVARHEKRPRGYIAHHAWAEEKLKTHRCKQCPTCGFWAIWVPKKTAQRDGRDADG